MIQYLKTYFSPSEHEPDYSLAILDGVEGSRLGHDHQRQFHYVYQSLMLWRNIASEMFRFWFIAEKDLLSENHSYILKDTGQGLNRVQPAPETLKAMTELLERTKQEVGEWVGSSQIHLGDHNVPNALMFIDKYTQVCRIINPVILTVGQVDTLYKNPEIKSYFDAEFGGATDLKKTILRDFFRFAFDGSGADNFYDAGSCIDGRLTSAWNWCSKLSEKEYYYVFRLAGFTSFDGDFQK